ncbi:tumor necrosis factor receptor superfamily member 5 [Denticeps clupeoides]|uniref:tumor necrosis factor receptor superfamily member 5 n=1 Tax=Denticeps clupeoides TaxID=299321 RepID=UPI0010A59C40|nr:tumor necrosis factor receptor superfamily member 5-like [Denticeps clupeoides]
MLSSSSRTCWTVTPGTMKLLVFVLLALPSCVDSCDTQTEYLKDGECCNMCGPGTRMTDSAICRDPYCKDCEEDEYQAGFTKETRCRRQPSCDPNVHLEPVLPRTTKIFSPCKCLKGYHCSSESCTSCNKDTVCGPGYEVSRNATETSDTECKPCPHGTFSNASSYESRCRPWTRCEIEEKPGSTSSDNVCRGSKAEHVGTLCAVIAAVAALFVLVLVLICRKIRGSRKIILPDDEWGNHDDPGIHDDILHNQYSGFAQAEENEMKEEEGQPGEEVDSGIETNGLTDGGQPLHQEEGKEDVLSQSESSYM